MRGISVGTYHVRHLVLVVESVDRTYTCTQTYTSSGSSRWRHEIFHRLICFFSYSWRNAGLSLRRRTDPVLHSACSRRVTTMWVNRPLQVSQLGQLSLSSLRGPYLSSRPVYQCALKWRHLVNAYGVISLVRLFPAA